MGRREALPVPETKVIPSNEEIAEGFDEISELLAAQDAKPFRAMAYRRAAEVLRSLSDPVATLLETGGLEGLTALPGIGETLARAIAEKVETGQLSLLERLRGQADVEALFATLPGLGPELAKRVHDQLGVETLEEFEAAAHDGRLAQVRGFGARRLRGVVEALAGRLGSRARRARRAAEPAPIEELLDVDREYREKAAAGSLRRIAPRRFNPEGRAWLPILHAERDGRHYTALFSNTARAHELGKTNDWVVIYQDDGRGERQATVVSETRGPLAGRRVIRGREKECMDYYARKPNAPSG
jgi:Holliday junction resolvasome RuvABC DNA-binding subunit